MTPDPIKLADRSNRIWIRHEPLANQKRPVAGGREPFEILARLETALADGDDIAWDSGGQPIRRVDVHLQRAQIPVVDADDPGTGINSTSQLGLVVHLDKGRQTQVGRARLKPCESRLVKRRDNQQHGVRASRPRLEQLIFVDDEVLAQKRGSTRRCGPRAE